MIQYLKGVEPLLQKESGLASFGAKVVPSLNGVDSSFMNPVAGSYLYSQVLKISYMIQVFPPKYSIRGIHSGIICTQTRLKMLARTNTLGYLAKE